MFENLILPIVAFLATAIADVVWVYWIEHVADRNPHRAAAFSVGIVLCGSIITWTLVDRNWIAYGSALAGAYAGTWLAVSRGKEP